MSSMVSFTGIDEMRGYLLVSSFLLHRLFTYQRNILGSAKRVSLPEWANEQASGLGYERQPYHESSRLNVPLQQMVFAREKLWRLSAGRTRMW